MSWDLRYITNRLTSRTASVGASGLDYSQFTPCTGNSDCSTCKHIQAVMGENKDQETGQVIDKDSDAIHQRQLETHQNTIPNMVKTQSKEEFWDKEDPDHGEHHKLTPEQKAKAKARAKAHGRKYPNLVDNAWAAKQ